MTPTEHYAEAERLAQLAVGDFPATPIEPGVVALAQVHATLATAPTEPSLATQLRKRRDG